MRRLVCLQVNSSPGYPWTLNLIELLSARRREYLRTGSHFAGAILVPKPRLATSGDKDLTHPNSCKSDFPCAECESSS